MKKTFIEITSDTIALDKLIAQLVKKSYIEIGIFNSSRDDGETNANIGYKHEMGIGVPQRSFIWLPLIFKKHLILEFFNNTEKHIKYIIEHGLDNWLILVMNSCMEIIRNSFASGGYGLWKPLSPSTINKKGSSQILVDTGQMLKAITSMVFRKSN